MHTIWEAKALADLENEIGYIQQNSPQNAEMVLNKVLELSESISKMPLRFPIEPNFSQKNIRYATIFRYKMVYMIGEDAIYILRLFNTWQSPERVLEK